MPCKVVVKFKMNTVFNNIAGRLRNATWQERFYHPLDDPYAVAEIVKNGVGPPSQGVIVTRAALLPRAAYIDGFTVQPYVLVNSIGEVPTGNAISFAASGFGPPNVITDFPQMGLYCTVGLAEGRPQRVPIYVRCLPQNQTVTGEWDNSDRPYKTAVNAYLAELVGSYGTYVDEVTGLGNQSRRINVLGANGLVSYLGEPGAFNPETAVKITRTTLTNGTRTGGIFRITGADADARTFTIRDWTKGLGRGGLARPWARVFALFATGSGVIVRTVMKKIGGKRDYRGQNRSTRL